MKISLSLTQIWTALILFVVIAPATMVMIWYGHQLYDDRLSHALQIERQANESLRDKIESEVKRLKTLLKNKSDPLSFLVDKPRNLKDLKEINIFLGLIVEREPAVNGVIILSKQADVIAVIEPKLGLSGDKLLSADVLRAAGTHWGFDKALEHPEIVIPSLGRIYVGSPVHHEAGFAFNIAVPIGKPARAVLIAEFDVEKLWPAGAYKDHGSKEQMRDYILDRRGSLVTAIKGSDHKPGDIMTHLAIVRTALINGKWPADVSYVGVTNQPVYGTLTTVPALSWTLVSEVIVSKITKPIREQLLKLIIFTLFGLAAFIWFALHLATKTIKPIQLICDAIDSVTKGDYQSVLALSGIRELDMMATSFNSMTKARQNAENLLREREQDLAITLNSIGDAVITTDSESHVTRMNPVAEQLTGWSLQEAQGQLVKTIFPIINATTREPIESPVDKVLATGEVVYLSNHTTLIAKDGAEYQIADSAAPIRDMDDNIMGMVLIFNDITEQYQLREKAKEARLQMQKLLDDMQTMVIILEPDGTLNFVNNTPLKIAGLEPVEVLGKKLWESPWFSYDPKLQAMVKSDITDAVTGKAILRDTQIFTLNGPLWIEFSIHPVFDSQGAVIQLVVEGRDVSQRKTAEEKVMR
ncbi:MAG: PAS domain-containing protein, partial [Proteobacteria bacterium]|nr:PAS domain-containing protein [Pseudomonadota bacterium]